MVRRSRSTGGRQTEVYRHILTLDVDTYVGAGQLSTAGEFACFLAEPGKLPFQRHMRRRAMQWMVTDQA